MNKIQEDDVFVTYDFSNDIWEKASTDPEYIYKTKTGYCRFNKQTEEFALDKGKTDPYFTEKSREVIKVHTELIIRKRNNLGFPNFIEFATPG